VRRGDVIVSIGNEPVSKSADVAALVKDAKAKGKKFVLLQVKTRDQTRFVPLSLEGKKAENKDKDKDKDKKDQQNGEKSQEPKKF
jgi:serine protease Do